VDPGKQVGSFKKNFNFLKRQFVGRLPFPDIAGPATIIAPVRQGIGQLIREGNPFNVGY
jgi:hypothetical protein